MILHFRLVAGRQLTLVVLQGRARFAAVFDNLEAVKLHDNMRAQAILRFEASHPLEPCPGHCL